MTWIRRPKQHRFFLKALSDRLLSLVRDDEPDAARWVSQAAWMRVLTIRSVTSEWDRDYTYLARALAPLLQRHPESPEAFFARYAVAVELAAGGYDSESYEVLRRLADQVAACEAPELPPKFLANFYFFCAREAHLVHELDDATRFAELLLAEARILGFERESDSWFRLFGVLRASAYEIFPSRYGAREWVTGELRANTYFGYSMQLGKLQDEIARLVAVIKKLDARPAMIADGGVQAAYDKIGLGCELPGVQRRLEFLQTLIAALEQKRPVRAGFLFSRSCGIITWLADLAPIETQPELQVLVKRLIAARNTKFRSKYPSGKVASSTEFGMYIAARMFPEASAIADRALASGDPKERARGIHQRMRILIETKPYVKIARFLERELIRFDEDFENHDGVLYRPLVDLCAWAYLQVGDLDAVASVYRRGLAAHIRLAPGQNASEDTVSMLFHLGWIEERRGNKKLAADAFKKVLQYAQGKRWRLGEGMATPHRLTVDELAIEYLERLRGNRTSVTPSRWAEGCKVQFERGEAALAAGDYCKAIDRYYRATRCTFGLRFLNGSMLPFDVDYSVGEAARMRLRELRLGSDPG